jgi:hypothetical protein
MFKEILNLGLREGYGRYDSYFQRFERCQVAERVDLFCFAPEGRTIRTGR